MLARIVQMVADAQRSRAPIQRMADRIASLFVPAVIAVAVIAFILWATVGAHPRLAHAIIAAVAVLIIGCTCALGLATPVSIMVGVVMLTGDNRVTAEAVGRQLGIDRVGADTLPDHKSDIVNQLRAEGRIVAMAGDGLNDAAALAAGIPIAAGILKPAFELLPSPEIAAAAMALFSVSVISNALRLRRRHL